MGGKTGAAAMKAMLGGSGMPGGGGMPDLGALPHGLGSSGFEKGLRHQVHHARNNDTHETSAWTHTVKQSKHRNPERTP